MNEPPEIPSPPAATGPWPQPAAAPQPWTYSYQPPAAPPGVAATPRWWRGGAGLLAIGLLVGSGAMFGALRLSGVASTAVHIQVDTTHAASTTSNAVAVAKQLTPAVGTIIALGSGGSTTGSASLGSGFV